jgi:Zn-dependent peptidase ImmA (M78 family)
VYLREEAVWKSGITIGEPRPLDWPWIDLLDHLAGVWPWLLLEEKYPCDYLPPNPALLRQEARRHWGAEEQIPLAEEEAIYRFETRHDLAYAMKGVQLPRLFLLREGLEVLLGTPDFCIRRPLDEVLETLQELGDFIAECVEPAAEGRGKDALERWRRRNEAAERRFLELRTGLNEELLSLIADAQDPASFWEWDGDLLDDSELMAAARMGTSSLSLDHQKNLLWQMKGLGKVQTDDLDHLSEHARDFLDQIQGKDYEKGYELALWLRGKLGLNHAYFDVERQVHNWKVQINEIVLDDCDLHAVACWGKNHGPALLLNTGNRARPQKAEGKRSTLAHEVCHLLADRVRSLPAAEVLGGNTPLHVERRANAFSAEMLLPRETAMAVMRRSDSATVALDELSRTFGVSRQLAALQIYNHPSFPDALNLQDRSYIRQVARLADGGSAPP